MSFRQSFLAGISLAATVVSAAAANAESAAKPVAKQVDFIDVLAKGGPMMIPLGILSVITVLLILVFLLTIRRNSIVSDRFMNTVDSMIRKRDYLGLVAFSHRRNECMARITQKTMDFIASNPGVPFEDIREVTQTEGSRQAGMLTSRITYLSEIGAIAPMIGLLGTVMGMIKAFYEISTGGKQGVREMGFAEGVSEALVATATGLAISILAFVFYSLFRARVQKYICELEAAATHLVALLHAQLERQAPHSITSSQTLRSREEQPLSAASLLGGERPDLRGI